MTDSAAGGIGSVSPPRRFSVSSSPEPEPAAAGVFLNRLHSNQVPWLLNLSARWLQVMAFCQNRPPLKPDGLILAFF